MANRLYSPFRLRSEPILDRGEVNTTKRLYESMYIIDTTLADEQVDSIIGKYSKIIHDQGGEVKAVGRWDKRRLAYDIMGRREGLYILMFFEGEPAAANELDRIYRISDDVFRHLITRVELDHVDTSRIDHPLPTSEAAPVEAPVAVEEPAEVTEEAPEAPAEATEEAVVEETPAAEEVEAPAEATEEAVVEETPAAEEVEAPAEAVEEAPVEETPAAEEVEAPAEAEEPKAEPEAEPKA